MRGLQIEAIYEHGTPKLPREPPLMEGATVTIPIHPPGRSGVIKHVRIPFTGNREEFDRWLNEPDEGQWGSRDDDVPSSSPTSLDADCPVYVVSTK